jgi:tetratricopeptide (TPR) repeat protein
MSEKKSLGLLSFFKTANKEDVNNRHAVDDLYNQAIEEFRNKNLDNAESLFRQILSIDNNHIESIVTLGKISHYKENYNQAIKLFKKYLNEKPNSFDIKIRLAKSYISNNEFDSAIGILNQLNNLETDQKKKDKIVNTLALAYYNEGNFFRTQGKFKEAVVAYEQAQKFEDNEPKNVYYIGTCYIQASKENKALELFNSIMNNEKYLEENNNEEEFSKYSEFLFDICFSMIKIEIKNNNNGRVVNIAQNALKLNINDLDKNYFKAKINIIHKKNELAIKELNEFVNSGKYLYEVYNDLYNLYILKNNLNGQLDVLEKIEQLTNNEQEKQNLLVKIGVLHVILGDYKEGYKILLELEGNKKADIQMFKYLGKAMLEAGDMELAFKKLTLAKVMLKNDVEVVTWLIQYYKKTGEFETFLKEVKKILEINPEEIKFILEYIDYYKLTEQIDEAITIANDYYTKMPEEKIFFKVLADLHKVNKNNSESMKYYEQYLESIENDYDAVFELAMMYFENVYIDKSVVLFERLVKNSKKHYLESQSNLVNIYISKGNFQKALELLDKTISLKPDYVDAYIKYGKINLHLGKKDKAISYLNSALYMDPDNKEALYVMESAR